MAFVPSTGVSLSTSSLAGAAVSVRSSSRPSVRSSRVVVRASIQEENRKAKEAAQYRGPQGFTQYSEKVNGRMAMVGFTVGLMTEIINPSHPTILKQVEAALDFIPFVHALTL